VPRLPSAKAMSRSYLSGATSPLIRICQEESLEVIH
jgi:hypothetical protein